MLSAAVLRDEVDVILDLIAASKMDEARQRIELLRPRVTSDYGKGAMLALSGVMSTLTKSKGGELLDREKTRRTAERIMNIQMLDDVDRGYFQTLTKWMKKVKPAPPRQESHSAPQA